MGTHPIFESDFDCLTEWDDHILDRDHDLEKNQREGDDHLLGHQALEVDHPRLEVHPIEELNIHQMMRMIQSNIEMRNQKVPKNQKSKCHPIHWWLGRDQNLTL